MSPSPRVLCISTFDPLPLDRGDSIRTYGLATGLATCGIEVDAMTVHRDRTSRHQVQATWAGRPIVVHPRTTTRPRTSLAKAANIVCSVGPRPYWVHERYSRSLERAVVERSALVDVVLLQGEAAGAYASAAARSAVVIWDKYNVLTRSAALGRFPLARRALLVPPARRFEARVLARADRVVVTSSEEAARLFLAHRIRADAIVASGIASTATRPLNESGRIGWMGSLTYGSNVDGLVEFLEDKRGWCRFADDGLKLDIVGPGQPSARLEAAMGRHASVAFRGYIETLGPWFDGLECALAPLWAGAGVKLKTVSFLGESIPLIGTPVAWEGTTPPSDIMVAASVPDFYERYREWRDTPALKRSSMVEEGRAQVEQGYSWKAMAAQYAALVRLWSGPLRENRSADQSGGEA